MNKILSPFLLIFPQPKKYKTKKKKNIHRTLLDLNVPKCFPSNFYCTVLTPCWLRIRLWSGDSPLIWPPWLIIFFCSDALLGTDMDAVGGSPSMRPPWLIIFFQRRATATNRPIILARNIYRLGRTGNPRKLRSGEEVPKGPERNGATGAGF